MALHAQAPPEEAPPPRSGIVRPGAIRPLPPSEPPTEPAPTPGPTQPPITTPPFDETSAELAAAPCNMAGAVCPVSCGAPGTCIDLPPGNDRGRDDSCNIVSCLMMCRCVHLVPNPTDPSNVKFVVRQPLTVLAMSQKVTLVGEARGGQQLPLLKATGTCSQGVFIEKFTEPGGRMRQLNRYKALLSVNRAPGGVISDLRLKVADYRQSCLSHTIKEAFAVDINNSDGILLENLRVSGQTPASGADTGGGIIGGVRVSFSPGAILRGNRISDLGYAIGDDPDDCLTANGVAGIKLADSANALIDNNDVTRVSFGIAVVNENVPNRGNTSNGTIVTNNRITGAAGLHCETVGKFSGAKCDPSTLTNDRGKIRCSQGRALRFEGIPSNLLKETCAENNYAVLFGGREGETNASGLDLSGYVQRARILRNVFDGRNSHVEFTFQPRAVPDPTTPFSPALTANTVDNIVQANLFVGADKCDVNFQSLQGKQVVADQCGLGRADNSGNNQFDKFSSDCGSGTTPPGRCSRNDVGAPPQRPKLEVPMVMTGLCPAMASTPQPPPTPPTNPPPSNPPPTNPPPAPPAGCALLVSPTSLSFSGPQGGPNPVAQLLNVANGSGGSVAFAASESASFLSLSPTSGSTPGAVNVFANVAGLSPGTYPSEILVGCSSGGAAPVHVPVTLTVTPGASAAAPGVIGFLPSSGSPGAQIQVAGSNFTGITSVTIAGQPALFTVTSPTQLLATVPNAQPGCGRIQVGNGAGSGQSPDVFALAPPGAGPVICSFTPLSGRAGDSITVRGGNLFGLQGVTFNGVAAASFFPAGSDFLGATVPGGATTGRLRVTTTNGTATSPTDFVILAGASAAATAPAAAEEKASRP